MATRTQWDLADMAIEAFKREFPFEWMAFQKQLREERTDYNLAKEGGLKKASFRNTGAFPVVYNPDGSERANMLKMMKKIFPNFIKSKTYAEFMRKYPELRPSAKTNAGGI